MRVAKWAGLLPPGRWDSLSGDEKAELIVFHAAEMAMEQYEVDHPPKPKEKP